MIDGTALQQAVQALSIAVVAVGVLSIGVSVMMKALSIMSTNLSTIRVLFKNLIPGFIVLGTLIWGTIGLLNVIRSAAPMLDGLSGSAILKFVGTLVVVGGLVAAFGALAKLPGLSGTKSLAGLIPGFAGVAGVIVATTGLFAALNVVLPMVNSMNWNDIGKFTAGLAVIGVLVAGLALLGPI